MTRVEFEPFALLPSRRHLQAAEIVPMVDQDGARLELDFPGISARYNDLPIATRTMARAIRRLTVTARLIRHEGEAIGVATALTKRTLDHPDGYRINDGTNVAYWLGRDFNDNYELHDAAAREVVALGQSEASMYANVGSGNEYVGTPLFVGQRIVFAALCRDKHIDSSRGLENHLDSIFRPERMTIYDPRDRDGIVDNHLRQLLVDQGAFPKLEYIGPQQ